jgi:prevent-host-death family protein
MKTVSASVARQSLPELLGEVTHGSEQVVIERHGKPVAALVPLQKAEAAEGTKGPEWDELARVLPELNTRLDRMIATVKALQHSNRAIRKELDRLQAQRKQLLWHS